MKLLISEARFYKSRRNALIPVECKNCKRKMRKRKKYVLNVLHGNITYKGCRYCRGKPQNISSTTRSKAEVYLCALILHDFPELELRFNDREVLSSGLELDVYIPAYKFAIEVNGIFHYEVIHRTKECIEKLAKVQKRDLAKKEETNTLGIHLLVIDIHNVKNKLLRGYIKDHYVRLIRPILRLSTNEYFVQQAVQNQESISCF